MNVRTIKLTWTNNVAPKKTCGVIMTIVNFVTVFFHFHVSVSVDYRGWLFLLLFTPLLDRFEISVKFQNTSNAEIKCVCFFFFLCVHPQVTRRYEEG